jgi:hypothetical protein
MWRWCTKHEFPSFKHLNLFTITFLQINQTPQMNLFLVVASWPTN